MAQRTPIFPPPPLEPFTRSPARRTSPIRSPIRSPKRRSRILTEEIDPLLDNLSPELFLNALSAINAVSNDEQHAKDLLFKTISSTSLEEQAFGARAAIAAQKLREWLEELRAWEWPSEKEAQRGKGFEAPQPTKDGGSEQKYWGCLPVHVVIQYEKRVEAIRDGIDGLDVESLKEYVLNAHIGSRSRPSSSHSTASTIVAPLSYVQLRDFTAIVTATILRALPTLTRLMMLLKTWDVRLFVLRQVPGLLRALNLARNTMQSSLSALRNRSVESEDTSSLEAFRAAKDRLEGLVLSAGRRMDRVLDALDGREDSLPEDWIDKLEAVEGDFAIWTVEAEKRAIENELKRYGPPKSLRREPSATLAQSTDTTSPGRSRIIESVPKETVRSVADVVPQIVMPAKPVDNKETRAHILEEPTANSKDTETDAVSAMDQTESMSNMSQSPPAIVGEEDSTKVPDNIHAEKEQDARSTEPLEHLDVKVSSPSTSATPGGDMEQVGVEEPQKERTIKSTSDGEGLTSDLDSQSTTPETAPVELRTVEPQETQLPMADVDFQTPHPQPADGVGAVEKVASVDGTNEPLLHKVEVVEKVASIDGTDEPLLHKEQSTSPLESPVPIQPAPETPSKPSASQSNHELSPSLEKSCLDQREKSVSREPAETGSVEVPTPKEKESASQSLPESLPSHPGSVSRESEEENDGYKEEISSLESPGAATQETASVLPKVVEQTPSNSRSENSSQSKPALQSSPATNADSDRTLREALPEERSSPHAFYPTFRHEAQEASLPLQRFINEGLDVHFEMEEPLEDSSILDESYVESPSVKNRTQVRGGRGSLSPPPEIVARPAIGSSRSKVSQIPSLAKGNPTLKKRPVKTNKENVPAQVSATKKESGLRQSSLPAKISGSGPRTPLNTTRLPLPSTLARRLREQPSIDSIGSIDRSSEIGDSKSLQPEVIGDDSLATISPFQDTDDELHEKINSILTGIPGRIRLKSVPAQDSDQQSVISSTSSSRRHILRSKSSFSSLSRSGTPTPSITMAPAFSRAKRQHAHSSDDNAVRIYHLHHKGKTQPTKLFVRSVGPNGERVMVRVGGGWADLGEYLREYVLHHGRRAVSTGKVEVQGLPTQSSDTFSSPNSFVTLTPDGDRSLLPSRPGSVLSNRPASSLAVRKTRRPSRPSGDLPALTTANIETAASDQLPPMINVSSRRPSISSVNSVSVSSTIGEFLNQSGSPYQPSGRTPSSVSHSTPLGLAGPKPRSRQVSMTPESEAWVEDIVGQARKTSSSLKPDHAHSQRPESRLELQDHSSSVRGPRRRNSNPRSVSDIGAGGLNRRVLLRGLDNGTRRE